MAFDFTSCFDYNCDMTDGTCQDPEMNKFDLERCLTRFELFPPNEKCKTCILQKNLKNATSNFIDFAEVEQIFAMGNSYDDLGVPDNLFLIFDNARFLSFIGVHMANLTARYFQGASNLQAFTADGSSLMNLDAFVFSHAYNMKKIWMVQCRIESIHPDAFKNLTKLTLLDLSDNAFLDLDDELLSDLLDLTYLDISVNHLTSISDNFFKNLFKLEDLSLGDNKFKTIGCVFNDLQKLEFLYLENNILEEIYPEPCNHSLSSLTDLWLQGNNLKSVPKNLLKDSKSVTKLLLPSTIESIEKDDFEELENLKCMSIDGSKTGILNDRLFRVEINSFSSLSNITNLHLRVLCTNQEWIDTVPINMSEVRKDLSASDCARCIVPQTENGIIVNAFEKETLSSNQFFKGTAKVECDQDYLYVVDNEDENKITCNIQKWNKQFPECLSTFATIIFFLDFDIYCKLISFRALCRK